MVCFIHRPDYYRIYNDEKTGKDLRGLAQIIVAKHRNGATDSIWLRFRHKLAKFQNEKDAYDENELPPLPAEGENSMAIQSKMNNPTGATLNPQMSPDGYTINALGEDINIQL